MSSKWAAVWRARGRATGQAAGKEKWTFLVYMAGDNNLNGEDLRDIAEMARVG
jgi:hypothetical protein